MLSEFYCPKINSKIIKSEMMLLTKREEANTDSL
jgi:hypothetical protein